MFLEHILVSWDIVTYIRVKQYFVKEKKCTVGTWFYLSVVDWIEADRLNVSLGRG